MVGLMPPDEGLPAARGAAGRALQLDRIGPTGDAGGGRRPHNRNWVRPSAAVSCLRAGARAGDGAVPLLAVLPRAAGPLGRMARNLEPALAAELMYLLGRVERATALCAVDRVDEGLAVRAGVSCHLHFAPAVGYLAREHAIAGRLDEARTFAERAYTAVPHHPNAVGMLAGILEHTGDRNRARSILEAHGRERAWSLRAPAPKLLWPATGSMSRWITWRTPLPNAIPASGSCS